VPLSDNHLQTLADERVDQRSVIRLPDHSGEGLWRRRLSALSSNAKRITPADLISARLFKTLRSVAMRSYSHLSEDERDQIGVLRTAGRSMGAIARALGRAKATISRELQRNALPLGGYSPLHAAACSCPTRAGSLRRRPGATPMSVEKIGSQHQARKAVLYVRQSSVHQCSTIARARGCSTPCAIVSCNSAGRKSR
jgi:hypothetical protein